MPIRRSLGELGAQHGIAELLEARDVVRRFEDRTTEDLSSHLGGIEHQGSFAVLGKIRNRQTDRHDESFDLRRPAVFRIAAKDVVVITLVPDGIAALPVR